MINTMNGLFILQNKSCEDGYKSYEAIHIMVPGETEEEFDARLESYEEEE